MTTVVDTHVHVAAADRTRYPLRPGMGVNPWYDRDATVETLLGEMDHSGVDAAVLVQGHGAYSFDNSYCADARAVAPDRLVSVSIIDMAADDRVEQLTRWASERGMGGTRLLHLPPPEPAWLDDRSTEPVWRRARELGIRVSVCIVRRHLGALGRLLEWAPPVPVALDHSGLIELPGVDLDATAFDELCALARYPNLHLKVSPHVLAYGAIVGRSPDALVRTLADVFGAERLMWGSDWPNAGRPYGELVREGRLAAQRLTDEERALFLGGTACRIWPELSASR